MIAMRRMTTVEAKLFLREPMGAFFVGAFPAVLLVVLGAFFPGFTDPVEEFNGLALIEVYTPIVLAFALATASFSVLPVTLATNRQLGVLRRMSTTPVPPSRLLTAQLLVQAGAAVVGSILATVVAVLFFDVGIPANLPGFVLAFLLAAVSMLAVGLLIGAVAPSISAAQAIGMAVYFPMLFFAGVYFPREVMPAGLRAVSDATPIGAAVQAMSDTWAGGGPGVANLLVMGAWTLVAGLLAVRLFRWE